MVDRMTPSRTVYCSVGMPWCQPLAPRPSYFEIDHVFTSCGSPMNSVRYGMSAGWAMSSSKTGSSRGKPFNRI